MTTRPTIAPHATSWIQPQPTGAHGDHHIARNLALTIGASAVVLAGLAGVQYARTQVTVLPTTSAMVVPAQALRALAADGAFTATKVSVPAAATRALASDLALGAVVTSTVTVPRQAANALQADTR
jgi:hypothetical protein